jgi:hypothetical protein
MICHVPYTEDFPATSKEQSSFASFCLAKDTLLKHLLPSAPVSVPRTADTIRSNAQKGALCEWFLTWAKGLRKSLQHPAMSDIRIFYGIGRLHQNDHTVDMSIFFGIVISAISHCCFLEFLHLLVKYTPYLSIIISPTFRVYTTSEHSHHLYWLTPHNN